MRFLKALLSVVAVGLAVGASSAADGKKDKEKDDINGARWAFTAFEGKEVVEEGTFRATTDGKVFKGGTQIGTWASVDADTLTVEITQGKMAGTMKLELVNKKEKIYRGPWVPAKDSKVKGEKAAAKLKLLDD